MGTANHVDDPGGEPSQVGNGPELYWAGSQTKQTEIELRDCSSAARRRTLGPRIQDQHWLSVGIST